MKRAVLLVMSAILIAFTSCNQNEPTLDSEQSTTVVLYYQTYLGGSADLDFVRIYNAKEKLVSEGQYVGQYLVPYNGSISLTYHRDNDKQYSSSYNVGTMKRMYICVGWGISSGIVSTSTGGITYLN